MIKRKIMSRVRKDVPSYYYSNSKEAHFLAVYHKNIWFDGGFSPDCSLEEKADFYNASASFVKLIKAIIEENQEETLYLGSFLKEVKNFEDWSNLKEYDCFNNLSQYISNCEIKKINPKKDEFMIDYIVENGLRYLTNISFYLPKAKAIIRPDCHMHLQIFCSDCEKFSRQNSSLFSREEFNLKNIGDGFVSFRD